MTTKAEKEFYKLYYDFKLLEIRYVDWETQYMWAMIAFVYYGNH